MNNKTRHPLVNTLALASLALLLQACTTPPVQPLGADEHKQQLQADQAALRQGVPAIGNTLGLDEAIARALKFNLDRRARQMEEALALRQYDEVGYDRLPRLMAAAGYTTRDSDRIARSTDSITGQPSLANPSIAQDRTHLLTSLTLSWSLLDYGLASYNVEQAGSRLQAAAERRRKATHLLVQEVRVAYWRAASAQKLRGEVRATLGLADEALADSRKAEEERLRSPLDTLRYQRQLTENIRLLESIEQELATARFELAVLVNAPVVQNIALVADELPGAKDPLAVPAAAMEEQALAQNADLREHLQLRRIAAIEARKVVARAYPNLTFSVGQLHDTDNYLVNSSWGEAGVTLSMNLLNLLALPAQKRSAEAAIAVADQRRLAAHAALVAQVHIAREQLAGSRRQFDRADQLWQLDDRILQQTLKREEARAGSKLDRVAAQTTAIISQLRRFQALAQWHAAVSRLQGTLGVDPLPESADDLSLEQLRAQVRQRLLEL
ncbi:Outer membrane efflux protein [Rubrivivax sp. A210]|uniref:TolC family protein n=1 Tax=Rubrivivax sp. A210 TaxID=2772301 RepID=UPI00191A44DC|nr:TolC family protein [Rubrivivax sp. A210]CAD5371862.1 Outer membrane efflux protein [Rubrivivax sp. A210]